jgi:hypothetical protein
MTATRFVWQKREGTLDDSAFLTERRAGYHLPF